MKLNPNSCAFLNVSAVACLPDAIVCLSSSISASKSTGSRLHPTGLPINSCNFLTGSSHSGKPLITGLLQSNTFKRTISLPKETASSAFVKSPNNGGIATTVSVMTVLPSHARIDCFNSSPFIASISLVVQFNNLFIFYSSVTAYIILHLSGDFFYIICNLCKALKMPS